MEMYCLWRDSGPGDLGEPIPKETMIAPGKKIIRGVTSSHFFSPDRKPVF